MKTDELAGIEYKLLCMAVTEAVRYAGSGDIGAGARCLHEGLDRAEELIATGEPWASGLARSYRSVLKDYMFLCGVDPSGGIAISGTYLPTRVVYTPN